MPIHISYILLLRLQLNDYQILVRLRLPSICCNKIVLIELCGLFLQVGSQIDACAWLRQLRLRLLYTLVNHYYDQLIILSN